MSGGEKRVYFLKPIGMDGPIKIGCSGTPERRLKSLDIWSPFPLELLCSAPGENDSERAAHWHCRDARLHGEWFTASATVLDLVKHVRENGVLPPLEASPHPYGVTGKGKGNNPNRNHEWTKAKARLTRRVNKAEHHAYGWLWVEENRPAYIDAILRAYSGPFEPPPTAEQVAILDAYCGELLLRPRNTRTWIDWVFESPERIKEHANAPLVRQRLLEKALAA